MDQNQKAEPSEKEPERAPKDELATPVYVTVPQEEMSKLEQDAVEYKDKYIRQLAEMENLRKRLNKERQEFLQIAIQQAIVEFLNPIDNFENALKFVQQASDEVKNWALGFQMIGAQFKEVLSSHGVVPFTSQGKPFDPHLHEAVEMVATKDYPPGMVISETLRGYKMGERVIRPARVTVSKAPDIDSQERSE